MVVDPPWATTVTSANNPLHSPEDSLNAPLAGFLPAVRLRLRVVIVNEVSCNCNSHLQLHYTGDL
jgi:hypothetical protein